MFSMQILPLKNVFFKDYENLVDLNYALIQHLCSEIGINKALNTSESFIEEIGLNFPKIEPRGFQSQHDKIPATFSLDYHPGDLDTDEHVFIQKKQIFQEPLKVCLGG